MRLNVIGLAFALGILTALGMLFLGYAAGEGWIGMDFVTLIASAYKGFDTTLQGMLIGAGWGFVDGFIGGLLLAIFYNIFTPKAPPPA